MKSTTEYLAFNTKSRFQLINITPDVEKILNLSGIKEGLCLINSMHISVAYLSTMMKKDYIVIFMNG